MTLNVLCRTEKTPAGEWTRRRPVVVEVVRQQQPDLLGTQECMVSQLADLAADLPEYDVVPGPLSGGSRLPQWALFGAPPLALAGVGLFSAGRNGFGAGLARLAGGSLLGAAGLLAAAGTRTQLCAAGEGRLGEHCAIFYRRDRWRVAEQGAFWISPHPDRPRSVLPGTWHPRIVTWARFEQHAGGSVTVYNAHTDLAPWARGPSARVIGAFTARHWDGSLQVLVGDLNSEVHDSAYEYLLTPGPALRETPPFCDAWCAAEQRMGPNASLHGGDGEGEWPGRLDHVLYRCHAPVRVERVITVTEHDGCRYPSDHFPVVADLRAG